MGDSAVVEEDAVDSISEVTSSVECTVGIDVMVNNYIPDEKV